MTLTLGFSPCPNDTFIFDALVNKKIDTGGLDFDVRLEDVETLNQWAIQGRLDISKISYGALPLITGRYRLLDAGGALGKGVGPLLISRHPRAMADIDTAIIAIPGERTTAHLLFSLAFPLARHKRFMIFSDIEDAVLTGKVDCGVIIHENRFTYRQKGLTNLIDLGEFWESKTEAPIPLGGIVVRRGLHSDAPDVAITVNTLIRKSLEYAFANYPALPDFVKAHAQEMDETVMRRHIDLYVNEYSLSLGRSGKTAIDTLIRTYAGLHPAEPAHPLSVVGTPSA
ncbi:MAG TPA: 1,4-dihydroxy-6-naphthoate synthase [Puia sp.]|nr:1,4-dihydroxy-6-naphthoate synthase [Puia sp.]